MNEDDVVALGSDVLFQELDIGLLGQVQESGGPLCSSAGLVKGDGPETEFAHLR